MTPRIGKVRLVLSVQEAEALLWFVGFAEAKQSGRSKHWPTYLETACRKIEDGLLEEKQKGETK